MAEKTKTTTTELAEVRLMLSKDKQVIDAAKAAGMPVTKYIDDVLFKAMESNLEVADDAPAEGAKDGEEAEKAKPKGPTGHSSSSTFATPEKPKVELAREPAANPRRFRVDPKLVSSVLGRLRSVRASRP